MPRSQAYYLRNMANGLVLDIAPDVVVVATVKPLTLFLLMVVKHVE